jgi:hypothetical protein
MSTTTVTIDKPLFTVRTYSQFTLPIQASTPVSAFRKIYPTYSRLDSSRQPVLCSSLSVTDEATLLIVFPDLIHCQFKCLYRYRSQGYLSVFIPFEYKDADRLLVVPPQRFDNDNFNFNPFGGDFIVR